MAEKYFLTTDADSWWLRFRLEEGHAEDPTQSVTTEASLGDRPLGDAVAYRSGAGDSTTFTVTASRSGTHGSSLWVADYTAYYDSEAGVVDVPLPKLFLYGIQGERVFVRLLASPSTLIASAELVNARDSSREQSGGVTFCDGDEYLSFRIESGSVAKTYIGPKEMTSGTSDEYYIDYREAGAEGWPYTQPAYYDSLTGLADVLVASVFDTFGAQDGESVDYRLMAVGDSSEPVAQGVMTYSTEGCEQNVPVNDPSIRYELTANEYTSDLRFRLKNFDPDPAQAIVTSVTIGQSPQPITTGEGTFFLRYRIDNETVWRKTDAFFDDEEGVAEVDISSIFLQVTNSLEFRLVYYG